MSHDCCRRSRGRTARGITWVGASATLVLLPKCPACLAAYVAIVTGIGLPLAVATSIRWALIVMCVVVLGWLSVPLMTRTRKSPREPEPGRGACDRSATEA